MTPEGVLSGPTGFDYPAQGVDNVAKFSDIDRRDVETVARGPHEVREAPRRRLSASASAGASATRATGRAFRAKPNSNAGPCSFYLR